MSAGGSASESTSSGQSMSGGQSAATGNSFISQEQLPFLQNMWQQAQGTANVGGANRDASRTADQNAGFLGNAMNTLQGLGNPQAQIEQQTGALRSGLGKLFSEELMPSITSNAIMMGGGTGSGRAQVAQGVGMGQMMDAFTQGSADITGQANQQAIQAQSLLPGFAQANAQNTMQGNMGGMTMLQSLAGILGGPTVLNKNQAASWNASQSSQNAETSSGGFNLGFGGMFGG